MTIELYVFPPSPRAFKAMAVANYLGIDHELHVMNLVKQEQKSEHYAKLNPNMRIPTLKDGDFVLWEANAIIQYLAGRKPESGLLPTEERARLDVTRWQFWDLAHWDPACVVFILEHVAKPALLGVKEPDTAAIAKGTDTFHRAATVLDGHLRGKKFVAGDKLTVADFSLGAPLNYAEAARLPIAPYAEIRRWYATLKALPAWRDTLASTALPAAA
jgi:glutathione S-transferase